MARLIALRHLGLRKYFCKLFEQAFLLAIERLRCYHLHFYQMVTASAPVKPGDALILDADDFSMLGTGGYFNLCRAFDCRYLEFHAESGINDIDGKLVVDIVAFTDKKRVLLYGKGKIDVAGRTTVDAGIPLASEPQPVILGPPAGYSP